MVPANETARLMPIPGIILNVDRYILRTDSVIAEAMLGQGEALDCYNAHSQEAKKQALYIENQKNLAALQILQDIEDPVQRAEMYVKMFNPPTVTPALRLIVSIVPTAYPCGGRDFFSFPFTFKKQPTMPNLFKSALELLNEGINPVTHSQVTDSAAVTDASKVLDNAAVLSPTKVNTKIWKTNALF